MRANVWSGRNSVQVENVPDPRIVNARDAIVRITGLDALGALALAATPFITGQWREGRRHWVPHAGGCLFELASLAMTDPTAQGDFHGDVDAVRRVNMEDPSRKIYAAQPAVTPGAAYAATATP